MPAAPANCLQGEQFIDRLPYCELQPEKPGKVTTVLSYNTNGLCHASSVHVVAAG